jgi:hypothetical protein
VAIIGELYPALAESWLLGGCKLHAAVCGNRLVSILFGLSPNLRVTTFVDLDDDQVWVTTDGAILDVLLTRSGGWIDWHDNLFTTDIADVSCIVLHRIQGITRA